MELYKNLLQPNGLLLLSGFYTSDISDLLRETRSLGLQEVRRDEKETWAALLLQLK
jgi:ribosomal protein L11 methyltransferase